MIYERNTICCCYELVSSGADSARTHAQTHTDRHSQVSTQTHNGTHMQTHSQVLVAEPKVSSSHDQTNSVLIQNICKLIKTANKDWRNMSQPSGLDTLLSAALAMGCLMLFPIPLYALVSDGISQRESLPDAIMHPISFFSLT